MTESNLLQEIQEDLQRQKVEALWRRYGPYVMALVLAIIMGTAVYNYIEHRRVAAEQTASAGLLEILEGAGKEKESKIAALENYANQNSGIPQAVFAQFRAAGLAAEMNDQDKAVAIYDAITSDEKNDLIFRQFADLLYVQTQMDKGDPAALQARLQPLLTDSPWRYSAKEYSAHLAMKLGDKIKARQLFGELEQDSSAPAAMAQRAKVMTQLLNEDN